MSDGDDLAAFLAARLDEDERLAKAAAEEWDSESVRYEWEDLPDTAFVHARRHSPARVLRGIAAKRAILTGHGPSRQDPTRCRVCTAIAHDRATRFRAPCPTLRSLAAIYSDHPAYLPEWAP